MLISLSLAPTGSCGEEECTLATPHSLLSTHHPLPREGFLQTRRGRHGAARQFTELG